MPRYAAGDVATVACRPSWLAPRGFPSRGSWATRSTALVQATRTARREPQKNLGGTEIAYQALESGSVDVYPEYTGTIAEVILKAKRAAVDRRHAAALGRAGLAIERSARLQRRLRAGHDADRGSAPRTRDDLRSGADTRTCGSGFTHEFLGRPDGYPGLARRYGLAMRDVRGMQHELAYEALASGQIDVMDIYTTDPQIEKLVAGAARRRPAVLSALRRGAALPAAISRRARPRRTRRRCDATGGPDRRDDDDRAPTRPWSLREGERRAGGARLLVERRASADGDRTRCPRRGAWRAHRPQRAAPSRAGRRCRCSSPSSSACRSASRRPIRARSPSSPSPAPGSCRPCPRSRCSRS